jgi:hypothetical protein
MMSAAGWFRPRPVDRDATRAAIEAMQDELEDAHEALAVDIVLLTVLADRRVPPRACDPDAERRVLGWLLSGHADASDFAEIDAYDFTDPIHRWIFAFGVEVLESHARGERDGRPWPAEVGPSRDTVRRMALLELEENRTAARRHPALRTKARVKAYHRRCRAIFDALQRLPYPERVPQREIDLVAALGRAWSVVDQTYRVEPCERSGETSFPLHGGA